MSLPDHLTRWSKNKTVNPRTGKTIKEGGPTYRSLKEEWDSWQKGESPLAEEALRVMMEKLMVQNQPTLATRMTGLTKSLRDKGKTMELKKPSPTQVISEKVLNQMIEDSMAESKNWVSLRSYRFVLTPEAKQGLRERTLAVLEDLWKTTKWSKTVPRVDLGTYMTTKIDKYVETPHYFRPPLALIDANYRDTNAYSIRKKISNREAIPDLVNGIMGRYGLPSQVATALAVYLQASTVIYMEMAFRNALKWTGLLEDQPTEISVGKKDLP